MRQAYRLLIFFEFRIKQCYKYERKIWNKENNTKQAQFKEG